MYMYIYIYIYTKGTTLYMIVIADSDDVPDFLCTDWGSWGVAMAPGESATWKRLAERGRQQFLMRIS